MNKISMMFYMNVQNAMTYYKFYIRILQEFKFLYCGGFDCVYVSNKTGARV